MQVTYGEYSFPYPTVTVRSQYVYDTDERTLLGTRYQISVSGWITQAEDTIASFRDALVAMRVAVSKHAQRLQIKDSTGVVIYDFDPVATGGAGVVDDWAPKPEDLTISQITGLRAARYSWQVNLMKKECAALGTPNGLLSLTKTYSYSVDVSGYATRQVSGTLKVRKDAAPADLYRSLVTPPLPNRFRRTQQQFAQSPDCRTLTFSVVDVEEYRTLPTLVSDGEATFGVKVADLGARVFFTLQGRFKAPPSTPKSAMFVYLANLISVKFPLNDPAFLFEEASVDDSVYGNEIAFAISGSSVAAPPQGTFTPNYGAMFQRMLIPPPDSNDQAYLPSPYGSLPSFPHVAPLVAPYDACTGEPSESSQAPSDVSISRVDSPNVMIESDYNYGQGGVSQQHLTTPYIAYHERINYLLDYKVVRMDVKDVAPGTAANGPYLVSTAGPSMIITQAGYYVCAARDSHQLPPPPRPIDPSGRLLEAFIQPHNPEPIQDGQWRQYTLHWRYVIDTGVYYHGNYEPENYIAFPEDPRLNYAFDPLPFGDDLPWLRPGGNLG
jgi:hypothetical protein